MKITLTLTYMVVIHYAIFAQNGNIKQEKLFLMFQSFGDIRQHKIEHCVPNTPNITPNGSPAWNIFFFNYGIYNGYDLELTSVHCDSIRVIPLSELKNYPITTIQQLKQKIEWLDKQPKMFVDTEPSNSAGFRHSNGSWYLSRIKYFYVVERDEATQTAKITRVKISISLE